MLNDILKAYKNRKITAADSTKQQGKMSLEIWICHLFVTIKKFGTE